MNRRDYLMVMGLGFLVPGVIWGLFISPEDITQGQLVRIMYVHVPFAYLSTLVYVVMALLSVVFLWRGSVRADNLAHGCVYMGFFVTLMALMTGSIWGRPAWGVWWVWDARLTSELALLFIYFAIILVRRVLGTRGDVAAAVFSIVGVVLVPFVKLSVAWWSTLHQPPSLARNAIDGAFLLPLGMMAIAFTGIVFWCCLALADYFSLRSKLEGTKLENAIRAGSVRVRGKVRSE